MDNDEDPKDNAVEENGGWANDDVHISGMEMDNN